MREIILDILAPILLMVLIGALLQRRFKLNLETLTKLNIFVFVPAFVFDKVTRSQLRFAEMAGVVGITVVQVILLGLLVFGVGRLLRVDRKVLAAVMLAVMFYNSGNFGLPLAELAYPAAQAAATGKDGAAVQTFVLMTQNITNFTVGAMIAAWAGSHGSALKGLVMFLKLPILPSLIAALLVRYHTGGDVSQMPKAITEVARYLSGGLVPIALVTLGAQLASNPRWPRWKPVSVVVFVRLVYAPLQMLALLWLLHLWTGPRPGAALSTMWPWPAEMLVLTAGTPCAINTLLLTMELDGDANLAADCVFWTTVCSAISIAGWLMFVRWGFA